MWERIFRHGKWKKSKHRRNEGTIDKWIYVCFTNYCDIWQISNHQRTTGAPPLCLLPTKSLMGDDVERIQILYQVIRQNRETCTLTDIEFEKYVAELHDVTLRHSFGHSIRSIPLTRVLDNIKEKNIYSRQESKSLRGTYIYIINEYSFTSIMYMYNVGF